MPKKVPAIPVFKLVVAGGGGSGKSALTQMFIYGNFIEEYDPTTADSYRKIITVDGEKCQLDILDTAGQEEYMRDNYYRLGEGFIIVYAITMRDTFSAVSRFFDHILQVKGRDEVPIVLVGSKCDLESDRDVPRGEGEALSAKCNCPFFETSAKTRINVDEVFTSLVRIVAKFKAANTTEDNQEAAGSSSCCVMM
eukprot:TRINITY_DN270_c0_g1_i1.p1 TRINITY_DN270_c0_g1~~TRINITY_DN270_c0_g1_i1.p1  ORF type:complete len:202 (-),score=92.61 TRINITY_DN270_c0_g1_i1:56-640(-)